MIWIVAAAVGLFVAVLVFALVEARIDRRTDERVLKILKYSQKSSDAAAKKIEANSISGWLKNLDIWSTEQRWVRAFLDRANNAGLDISASRWVAYVAAAWVVITLVFQALFQFLPVSIILGLLVVLPLSRQFIVSREQAKRKLFAQQLPEFLLLIASSLRSGLSLTQSLDSVSQQGNGEVERQIRRATSEISMGMSPNDALSEVAIRMRSEDMKWVVVAISIQREVGGNLSVILDSVAETVRGRASIVREVSTLSAESRLSAWVLLALPIVVFVFFFVTRRDYVQVFWTTLPGILMLGLFVVLISLGALWMRSIVKIKW